MSFGPWQETKSSSGKIYYYNRLTEKSQWVKPQEWLEHDRLASGNGPKLKPITPPPMPPSISNHQKRERDHYYSPQHNNSSGNGYSNHHNYSSSSFPTKSTSLNHSNHEENVPDNVKLEAISDDDDIISPPIKRLKCEDPLANVEMISEDSLSTSKEAADERDSYVPINDEELDKYITEEFLMKVRMPDLEQVDAEARRILMKQRETEKELFDVIKDQISVRQLTTTTEIMRKAVEIRSEFAKNQCQTFQII